MKLVKVVATLVVTGAFVCGLKFVRDRLVDLVDPYNDEQALFEFVEDELTKVDFQRLEREVENLFKQEQPLLPGKECVVVRNSVLDNIRQLLGSTDKAYRIVVNGIDKKALSLSLRFNDGVASLLIFRSSEQVEDLLGVRWIWKNVGLKIQRPDSLSHRLGESLYEVSYVPDQTVAEFARRHNEQILKGHFYCQLLGVQDGELVLSYGTPLSVGKLIDSCRELDVFEVLAESVELRGLEPASKTLVSEKPYAVFVCDESITMSRLISVIQSVQGMQDKIIYYISTSRNDIRCLEFD